MKKLYTTIFLLLLTIMAQAQTFEFSLSYIGVNGDTGNYQIALMATPSSTLVDANTSDMGAGFYVPSGVTLGNFVEGNSGLPASEWESNSLSNTTDAYFVSRVEAGSTSILLNGDGPFELVLFDIIASPNPTSGSITFLENGDPVFNELLFIENYINIGATNAYLAPNNPSENSVNFATLTNVDVEFQGMSIYPNPVKDVVSIKGLENELNKTEVYSINGQKIMSIENNTEVIDMSALSNGVYFLKLYTTTATKTVKLLKE